MLTTSSFKVITMPKLIATGIFWLQWTLVTSLCSGLLLPMWRSIGPWSLVAYWFLLGFSQSLVLLQRLPWAFVSWFLVTSFAGVGWLILLILMFCLFYFVGLYTVDPSPFFGGAELEALGFVFIKTLPISFFIVAGGGTLLGWAQQQAIKRFTTRTSRLVIASVVSWLFGAITLPLLLFLFRTQIIVESEWNLNLITAILTSVGGIGGAIKGGVLSWLLHRARR